MVSGAFYTIRKQQGVHWLVDPAGRRMVYTSVQCVGPKHGSRVPGAPAYDGIRSNGGSFSRWVEATERRLKTWHFRGLGAWNHACWKYRATPYTECLNIWKSLQVKGKLKPIFDPDWDRQVEALVKPQIRGLRDAPALVGWFLDNEIPWRETWLLDYFDGRRADDPNKRAVVDFLKRRHRTIARLNAAWGTSYSSWTALARRASLNASLDKTRPDRIAFLGMVAKEFFTRTCRIVRTLDPHRLILGVRYAGFPAMEVVAAQQGHTDVVSINLYIAEGQFPAAQAAEANRLTGQPVWVTEFSWHAPYDNRSGDRNTIGFGSRVRYQASRGRAYEAFVEGGARLPFVIGFDWFQWCDESPKGRGDGEDVNFGLVDIHDRPYEDLMRKITRTNRRVDALHAGSAGRTPSAAPAPALPFSPVPQLSARPSTRIDPALVGGRLNGLRLRPGPDPAPAGVPVEARTGWCRDGLWISLDVEDRVRTVDIRKFKSSIEWFWTTDAAEVLVRAGEDAPDALDAASVKVAAIPDGAGKGKPFVSVLHRHRKVFGPAGGARVTQGRRPGGYRLDFWIPARLLQAGPLTPWQTLRFNVLVEDEDRVLETCWSAHQGDWTTEKPKTWGRLVLIP